MSANPLINAPVWKCRHYNEKALLVEDSLKGTSPIIDSTLCSKQQTNDALPPNAKVSATSPVSLGFLTHNNIGVVKTINAACFPINYGDRFYSLIIDNRELSRLAYINDIPVGVVCCRLDSSVNNVNDKSITSINTQAQKTEETDDLTNTYLEQNDTCYTQTDETSGTNPISFTVTPPSPLQWAISAPTAKDMTTTVSKHRSKAADRLCIMTLAVLEPYRRCGIGRILLDWVKQRCLELKKGQAVLSTGSIPGYIAGVPLDITEIFLHVWTANEKGLEFYKHLGFHVKDTMKGYYRNLTPPDCFVLTKKIEEDSEQT